MTFRITIEVEFLRHRCDTRWRRRTVVGHATTHRGLVQTLAKLVFVPGSAGKRKVVKIRLRGTADALRELNVDTVAIPYIADDELRVEIRQEGIPRKCGICRDCDTPPGIGGASFCYADKAPREPLAFQPLQVVRAHPPPVWCPYRPKPLEDDIEEVIPPVKGQRWRNKRTKREAIVLSTPDWPKGGSVEWRYVAPNPNPRGTMFSRMAPRTNTSTRRFVEAFELVSLGGTTR